MEAVAHAPVRPETTLQGIDKKRYNTLRGLYLFFVKPYAGSQEANGLALSRVVVDASDVAFSAAVKVATMEGSRALTAGGAAAYLSREIEDIAQEWQLPAVAF